MAQAQKGNSGAVSGLDNLSYLNQNSAAQVLRVSATRAPTTNDRRFKIGTIWINTSTNIAWILTSVVSASATWALASPGASDVDTLTGDAGGAISPAAGNITLAGGTNLASAGAGSTITFNMDAAITLATSVTSPLYTAAAGVDLDITAPAGQNIVIQMGDAAGANRVSFTDSGAVEVFAVDSNGALTFTSLTVTGAFTQTAGVVSISEDNSANAVGIANGTTARAITIGSSAAAHTITMGSVTGAASLDLLAGTGNFTLEGNVATTYAISGTGVNTGTITIGGGTGAQTLAMMNVAGVKTVNLANGVDGNTVSILNGINTSAQTINIAGGANAANSTVNVMTGTATAGTQTLNLGTGASASVLNIGNVTGATSLDLSTGTGNFTLEGNVASTYDISNTGVNTGTVNIAGGTGARAINIGAGGTGAKTIGIGAGASADVITIGDTTGAGSLDLVCGTGNFTLEGNVASTYDISNTGVNTGAVNIAGGTGARTITIGGGGTGAKTMNIGAAASADVITIGDTTGAGSLDLVCGTGNFTLEGNVATTYDISGTGVNTGTITIGGGTGAQTLAMMDSTGVKTVTLATGAAANIVTIGSTNTSAALTLQAGTGNITMTGTIEAIDAKFSVPTGIDINFNQSPVMQSNATTGAAPTGAAGDVNLMYLQEGVLMEQFIIGTQTIIAPRMTATGLLTSLDLTNAEGAEYNFGAARNNSRHAFTIGTSAAFFFELEVDIADVSGCEPFLMGFRRVQANDAAFANYTDFVGYGTNDGISPGDATIQTQLNTGGVTSTDTNDAWADGATHILRVLVSSAGVVTFTFDGNPPTATQAYTFDNTDVVVPFIHHLFNAAAPGAINLVSMQIGFQ